MVKGAAIAIGPVLDPDNPIFPQSHLGAILLPARPRRRRTGFPEDTHGFAWGQLLELQLLQREAEAILKAPPSKPGK